MRYAGGFNNDAPGYGAVVCGDVGNTASASSSAVGGGLSNYASGSYATIPCGRDDTASGSYSFAAGYQARPGGAGTFMWSDSEGVPFLSEAANAFLVRASGGVGLGENYPLAQLHVRTSDLSVPGTLNYQEEILVEGQDAVIGLYSGPGSTWGSALALAEYSASAGGLANKWTMARRTNSNGSALHFTFGTNKDYASNNTVVYIRTDGDVVSDGAFIPGGGDLAEFFEVEGDMGRYRPGDALVISEVRDRSVALSRKP